jgi:hypothetical protein
MLQVFFRMDCLPLEDCADGFCLQLTIQDIMYSGGGEEYEFNFRDEEPEVKKKESVVDSGRSRLRNREKTCLEKDFFCQLFIQSNL